MTNGMKRFNRVFFLKITAFNFNPVSTNVLLIWKPGSQILLTKFLKNTFERVTFVVKMQVIDLHLYLKCHLSTGVFQTFCK